MKITIKSTNFELTPKLRSYIQEKMDMLDKYYQGLIIARVEVEHTTTHHKQGKLNRAEVNLDTTHHGVVRVEKTAEDMEKAIDKVKDHLKRILSDLNKKEIDRHRRPKRK